MRSLPATVVSTSLKPLPNATVVRGDAADRVARLKEEPGAVALARQPVIEPGADPPAWSTASR